MRGSIVPSCDKSATAKTIVLVYHRILWGWATAMRTASVITAAVVAVLCSAQAALAQDFRYPPVPFYDWTGVYVGANVGYGSATINDTTTSGSVSTTSSQAMTGFLGGGQIGANYQYGHTVFGIEIDADATSQSTSSDTLTASMTSFATARARLGFAYDRIHYYVTGGGGYVQFSSSGTTTSPATGTAVSTTGTSRRTAWVAGVGSEHALTPNWILRFEFLYLGLLDNSQNSASAIPANSSESVYNLIGRAGLSYKFNWPGS
jgi:outer membrane immunogenic protein